MATTSDVIVRENHNVSGRPPPTRIEPTVLLEELIPGSVFIRIGTPVPGGMNLACKRLGEWRVPQGLNAFGLERRLASSGWNYFFVVPSLRTTRVALRREEAIRQAINAALRRIQHAKFNSMELVEIEVSRVLGVYRVRVTAQPRHIKDGPFLLDSHPHARSQIVFSFRRIFDKINSERPQIKAM